VQEPTIQIQDARAAVNVISPGTDATNRKWVRRGFGVVLLILASAALVPAVWASHQFDDVPTDHQFHDAIDWLADQGLTIGCNPPSNNLYCIDDPVTRGQMAVFLTRAYFLPPETADHFDDDMGTFFESAANRLFERGWTFGCGGSNFCGDRPMTRGETAAFLARAEGLPPTSVDFFVDDDGTLFEAAINKIAEAGITMGCNPPQNDRYCPDDLLSRGQIAAMLKRTLEGSTGSAPTTTTTTQPTTTTTAPTPTTTTPSNLVAVDDTATVVEDAAAATIDVLGNDLDPDAVGATIDSVTQAANGTVVITNGGADLTYQPDSNYCNDPPGTTLDTFTYTLTPGGSTATVSVTVTCAPDPPVAGDDAATTPEGMPLVVAAGSGVLANDTDPDASDTLTATASSGTLPSGAAFTLSTDGSFSYDPTGVSAFDELDGGESLDDTFTYTVTDSQGNTDTGLLTITVTGVNDAPVLDPASGTVEEHAASGTSVTTVTSSDVEGNIVTYSITAGNTGGAFAIDSSSGEITVASPAAVDFETTPSFTLTVQGTDDGTPDQTDTVDVVITVTDVNEPPVVDTATFNASESAIVGQDVGTVTFTDPDAGQTHSYAITAGNTGGAFAIDPATGEITVAATIDFETTPSYTLTVEVTDDGTPALSDSATITVNVTNVNEAPSITAPAALSAVRDIALVVTGISVADPDAGDIELTLAVGDGILTFDSSVTGPFTSITGNETDTVVVTATVAEINAALGNPNGLNYLNDTGFAGASDTLTLDIDDLGTPTLTASATVTIQFNQVPVAPDLIFTTNEETPVVVTLTATDADDDDLTFAIVTGPVNGSLSAIGPVDCTTANTCTAEVTYTPDGDFNGPDQFTYEADDGETTDTGTVAITVNLVNDAPVITLSGSTPTFTEGAAGVVVDGGLTVNDIDDTNLVSGTASITAGLVAGDTLFFTPVGGIVDTDPAPAVLALSGTTTLANWQTALQSVQFGTTSDNPTAATRTVSLTVNDGDVSSATVTKNVGVVPVNDAPVLTQPDATAVSYTENAAPTVITPNITATDVDSTNLVGATITIGTGFVSGQDVLSLGTNPQNGITAAAFNATTGTLTLSGTSTVANYQAALRDVRYSNSSNDPTAATRTINFQVDDGPGPNDLSNIVSRNVTVTPVNDPPIAPAIAYSATANMAVDIPAATGLLAGATDLEAGTILTVGTVSATTPAGGTITNLDTATGAFRFNPPPGVTGPITFTYTVCDNGNPGPSQCSAPATVTVTVAGPVIWFVNGSAAAGGTGRLTDPFQTVGAASTAIGANLNQRVFVYAGTYTQGIALNSGGWLVGQQVTGTNFDTVMGITPASGTIARPAIATGTAALQNTVTLQTNAVVRGIAINSGANTTLTGSGGITGVDVSQTTITSVAGTTLSLNNVAGTLTFTSLVKNGAGTGISLTNVAAAVTIPTAGSISNTSVAALDIDGGTGAFSFGGPINNSAGGRTIEVTNRNTGSPSLVQFSGVITGSGTGVNLDNNDNGTISFTGGLSLSTTTNAAFTAVNGGTITVTDPNGPTSIPNNTITTTTGTALTVANTNIGAAGLNFLSISAGTGANSAGVGISLDTTGSLGGLHVTGTAIAGSGGTIQHKTGANGSTAEGIGIYLNSTFDVQLARMQLNDFQNFAIRASAVNGLSLANTVISGLNGNDAGSDEGSLLIANSSGTIAISGTNVSGGFEDNLRVDYTTAGGGASATFNVTGSTFRDLQAAGQNAQANLRTQTSASAWNLSFNFTGANVFENDANTLPPGGTENWSDGILVTFEGPFQHALNVQNGTFHHLFQGMDIASNFSADVNYTLMNNTITFTEGVAAIALGNGSSSTNQSVITGLIQGNMIGTSGVAQSGNRLGQGIVLDFRGEETAQLTVHANTIRRVEVGGIDVLANTGDGDLHLQLTNNVIDQVEDDVGGGISDGIRVLTATGSLHDICLDARANDSFKIGAGAGDELQLRQSNAGVVFAIEGLTGSGTSAANVEAYLDGQNPLFNPADGGTRVRTVASVVNYTSVASCTTPASL